MRRTAVKALWKGARWGTVAGLAGLLAAIPASISGNGVVPIASVSHPADRPGSYPGLDSYDLGLDEVTVEPEVDRPSRPVAQVVWTSASPEEIESNEEVVDRLGTSGIPEVALRAYVRSQETTSVSDPACGIPWYLLAAIGRVESNHGRYGGAQLRADGYGTRPIRGIPLDGRPGVALIRDTDDGALDGDTVFDRAVGPMQFIPSSWRAVAADGNDDDRRDPNNIFDAAVGSATYLCAGDGDLRNRQQRAQAIFRYNHSQEYVDVVMALADTYERGQVRPLPHEEPVTPTPRPLPRPPTTPANSGPPPALPPEPPTPPRPPTTTTVPPTTTSEPPTTTETTASSTSTTL